MSQNPWQKLDGKWCVVQSDNLENYLGAVGVPFLIRKIAAKVASCTTIKVNGDRLKIQSISTFHTQPENEYVVNGPQTPVDFSSKRHYTATANWEEDKLVCNISASQDGAVKPQKVTRQLVNGELVQIMQVGDIVAKQRYKKTE